MKKKSLDEAPRSKRGIPSLPPEGERRISIRVPLEVDVTISSGVLEIRGITLNISATGLFLTTMRVLPLGTSVKVKFALPAGTVIARGTVTRVRQASDGMTLGLAVIFSELDELDRALIASYCGIERSIRA
jgi:uncharacterized protein (TIGR02266 family)